MKKHFRILLLVIICLLLSGCKLFDSSNKTITFNYNCEGLNEYKCKTDENNKLNCMIIILPCNNYSFLGWYDSPNGGNKINLDADFLEDTKIYAVWDNGNYIASNEKNEETTYKIKFNLNGGRGSEISDLSLKNGDAFPNLTSEIPSKNGYTFMGWYDNSDYAKGIQYYNEINISSKKCNLTKDLTLFAGWEKKNDEVVETIESEKYVVSFDANGGSGGQTSNIIVEYGKSMPVISSIVPTRIGYKFMGWYDNNDYKKGKQYYNSLLHSVNNYDKKNDLVLYAGWDAIVYKIDFNLNGGNGSTTKLSVSYGNELPTLNINKPTKTNYVFVGWYDNKDYTKGNKYYDSDNNSLRNYNKTSDMTLYAGWSKDSVVQMDISTAMVAEIGKQSYTGKEIVPGPIITINNKKLIKGVDYTLSYSNNINPGTANVTINGIGNYKGSKQVTFIISASVAKITCDNKTYNGNAQVIATCIGGTISNEIQTNAGSYIITCKGDSNHANAENKTCSISTLDLKNARVSSISNQKYTGSVITPTITVTLNGKSLIKNTDYTISYSNNTNAGTANVTITGKGNYKGTKTTTFIIYKETTAKPSAVITCEDKAYTGSAQSIASCSGGTISNDSQTNVGSYKITCKGDSSHTDAASKTCKITKANIANTIINTISNQKYTGSMVTPLPVVKMNNTVLKKDVDYTLSYNNNINPGNATVIVNGINNYDGSLSKTFTINPRITFNANGGSGTMSVQNVLYDTQTSISTNTFTRNGYSFAGWNTQSDGKGTSYSEKSSIKLTSNITLYAQWKSNIESYKVSFNLNNGYGAINEAIDAVYGQEMPSISQRVPTRKGYIFMGWYDNSDYTQGVKYYTDKNISAKNYDKKEKTTLYAGWKEVNYLTEKNLINFKNENNINSNNDIVVSTLSAKINGENINIYYVYNKKTFSEENYNSFMQYSDNTIKYIKRVNAKVLKFLIKNGLELIFLGHYDCDNGSLSYGEFIFAAYCNSSNRKIVIGFNKNNLGDSYYEGSVIHEMGHAYDISLMYVISKDKLKGLTGLTSQQVSNGFVSQSNVNVSASTLKPLYLFNENNEPYTWSNLAKNYAVTLKNALYDFSAYSDDDLSNSGLEFYAETFQAYFWDSQHRQKMKQASPTTYEAFEKMLSYVQ